MSCHARSYVISSFLLILLLAPIASADTQIVDFDAAYANKGITEIFVDMNGGNGIPDLVEFAVISTVLADATLDLSGAGGLTHTGVHTAFNANYARMQTDLAAGSVTDPDVCLILTGFMTLGGDDSVQFVNVLATMFGASAYIDPVNYNRSQAAYLENYGDADGDGAENGWEYVFEQKARAAYLAGALDAGRLSIPLDIDFDALMGSFPTGIDFMGDGIAETDELALLRSILITPALDLSGTGGVAHAQVAAAWRANYLQACEDFDVTDEYLPLLAAYATIGSPSWDILIGGLLGLSISPSDYNASVSTFLTPTGNADGDLGTNRIEYCLEGGARTAYLAGALDAGRLSIPMDPDFDAAVADEFGGWPEPDANGNSIPEGEEFALIGHILQSPGLDLSAQGGITHAQVVATWTANYLQALADTECTVLRSVLAAGYMTLGDMYSVAMASSNLDATGVYDNTLQVWLSGDGEADQDGFSNREEYRESTDRADYVAAVLDSSDLPIPMPPDFDDALNDVFGLSDGDLNGTTPFAPNGMLDGDELAVLGAILANSSLDLSATGGVTHDAVAAVWRANFIQVHTDLAAQMPDVKLNSALAGLITLGDAGSFELAAARASDDGVTLVPAAYNQILAGHLADAGDADGDGGSNHLEYTREGRYRPAYLTAALDQVLLTAPLNVDFDALLTAAFGSATVDTNANNFPDGHELALLAAVLANPALDETASGGVSHAQVAAVWSTNYLQLHADTVFAGGADQDVLLAAGYYTLGDYASVSFADAYIHSLYSFMFGGPYDDSLQGALDLWGDADGDGGPNATEFYLEGADRASYLAGALNATRYQVPLAVNFDSIFMSYFGSLSADPNGNWMADPDEFALIGAILANPALDLSATGGVTYAQMVAAWKANYGAVSRDIGLPFYEEDVALATAYVTLGDIDSYNVAHIWGVHSPPPLFDQSLVLLLPPTGDADGDGFTNTDERDFVSERAPYLALALNPAARPIPFDVDFDAAMMAVVGPPEIDFTSGGDFIMADGHELSLLSYILTHPDVNLAASGGLTYAQVAAAWTANYAQVHHDLAADMPDENLNAIVAGYITLGSAGAWNVALMIADVPLTPANYNRSLAGLLDETGDADGDGILNAVECRLEKNVRVDYHAGALDPNRITIPTILTPGSDPEDNNGPNGIPDSDEMALLAAILGNSGMDLSATGGLTHAQVMTAWRYNFLQLLRACGDVVPSIGDIVAGAAYLMAGDDDSFAIAEASATAFYGITLNSADYDRSLEGFLAFDGDADGDGVVNRSEYDFQGRVRAAYVSAALNPAVTGIPMAPDFDAALDVAFGSHTLDRNGEPVNTPNTMLDGDELALLATILANPALNLSSTGGITHALAADAWTHNILAAHHALAMKLDAHPGLDLLVAGLVTIGDAGSFALAAERAAAAGVVLSAADFDLSLSAYLARSGDADGDGASNGVEYLIEGGLRDRYLIAALDQVAVTVPMDVDFDAVVTFVHQTYFPYLPEPFENGGCIDDVVEFEVLSRILADPALDLTARGGVSHALAAAAWRDNYLHLHADLAAVDPPMTDEVLILTAAYITLGDADSVQLARQTIQDSLGISLNTASYDTSMAAYLSDKGDADGDGVLNAHEYELAGDEREAYAAAALDPDVVMIPVSCDFDQPITRYFEAVGGLNADVLDSGMPDSYQLALLRAVLEDETIDLGYSAGITHAQAQAIWQSNALQLLRDAHGDEHCTHTDAFLLVVGVLSYLNNGNFFAINTLLTGSGMGPLAADDYDLALSAFIPAAGDADGDTFTNLQEYQAFGVTKSREAYIEAALDPTIVPDTHGPAPVISGHTTLTNAVRTLTIEFGETVNGFDLSDIWVTDGEAVALQPAGPASTYTVDVMGAGDVTVKVYIPVGAATDGASNLTMPCVDHFEYPFDDVPPLFSNLHAVPGRVGPGRAATISFTANEPLQEPPTVSVNGFPAAYVRVNLNTYSFRYVVQEGAPLGLAQIEIDGIDMAGNTGQLSNADTLEILAVDIGLPLRAWPLGVIMALVAIGMLLRRQPSRRRPS